MPMWRSWLKRMGLKIPYPSGKHREFDPHHRYFFNAALMLQQQLTQSFLYSQIVLVL